MDDLTKQERFTIFCLIADKINKVNTLIDVLKTSTSADADLNMWIKQNEDEIVYLEEIGRKVYHRQ